MSSFNVNRVVLVARLTRDPELRSLSSGASVCGLRVACNSRRKDADGEYVDRPNYFDVSVYGASAENVSRYLTRGSQVAIDGRLEWREWETGEQARLGDRDGDGGETHEEDAGELVGAGVGAGDDDLF